jgi:hypothetical protein
MGRFIRISSYSLHEMKASPEPVWSGELSRYPSIPPVRSSTEPHENILKILELNEALFREHMEEVCKNIDYIGFQVSSAPRIYAHI